jgi:hypothetical protein
MAMTLRAHCLILALLATNVSAGGPGGVHVVNGPDYVVPAGSPVVFSKLGDFTTAYFTGRFTISGEYHFGNAGATEATEDMGAWDGLELYFVPDKQYRQKLPHVAERKVHEIWFDNREDFILAVIPTDVADKVRKTPGLTASGRASILVDGYEASVECDYAGYSVRFISLAGDARKVRVAQRVLDQYGC